MKTHPDSFGTFLTHSRRLETPPSSEAVRSEAVQPSSEAIMQILEALNRSGPMPTHALLSAVQLDLIVFAQALKALQSAELVEVGLVSGSETVRLSKRAEQLLVAQP